MAMHKYFVVLFSPVLLLAVGLWSWYSPEQFALITLVVIVIVASGMCSRSCSLTLPYYVGGKAGGDTIFFIHGWPDNKEVFDAQRSHLSTRYRCVTVDLPHFGAEIPGQSRWGYDFDELADMCADALRRCLKEAGQQHATLVIHDWGSFIGQRLQRKYPHLVSRMVVMDVSWSGRCLPPQALIAAGVFYQYWLAAAWLLTVCVPFLGEAVGTAMSTVMISLMEVPSSSHTTRPKPFSSWCNYPYFYMQFSGWSELFGMRACFDKLHGVQGPSAVPTLFLYGADKGFDFHSKSWEKKLTQQPGCRVVPLKMKGGTVGHWLQATAAGLVNTELDKWLS